MTLPNRAGAASGQEVLAGDLEFFTLYTTIDITHTGDYSDATQKDFESILQVIGLRAQPVILNNPVYVDGTGGNTMADYGAPTLTGAGWIFKFAFERADIHSVEQLVTELDNIVLNGGTVDTTSSVNTEFGQQEML